MTIKIEPHSRLKDCEFWGAEGSKVAGACLELFYERYETRGASGLAAWLEGLTATVEDGEKAMQGAGCTGEAIGAFKLAFVDTIRSRIDAVIDRQFETERIMDGLFNSKPVHPALAG